MKVWIFVEGRSDELGLMALFESWKKELNNYGWGIKIISLRNKPQYFKLIGSSVAEKLLQNNTDIVVGLPDLYPCKQFEETQYKHNNITEIQLLQTRLVKKVLEDELMRKDLQSYIGRFYASTLKHDLEMLLLAAHEQLCQRLDLRRNPRRIANPENQNQSHPPKKVIIDYFKQRSSPKSYQETRDAPAILREATLREMVLTEQGRPRCPAFKSMLDWVGEKTGVQAY